ncbi:MAG: hypothetical protein V1729_05685 [Candidatus Woesearchaeota archaeon]
MAVMLLSSTALAKPATPPGQTKFTQPTTTTTTLPAATTTSTSIPVDDGPNWEMIGAIVGILAGIGAGIGWYFSYRKKAKTSRYMRAIRQLLDEHGKDRSKCEAKLYLMKDAVEKDFTDGKLDEQSMDLLHRKIDKSLKSLRMGAVDTMDISSAAKKELAVMLKDGKISDGEYSSFTKSKLFSKTDISKVKDQLARWKGHDKTKKPKSAGNKR